jgi:hypothetical protein
MIQIRKSILCIILFMIIGTVDASPSLTNSGGGNWQNYVDITIKENSGSTLMDYQISVQMSGGNFPANARPDGADIRFTDANGTELGYWIENWDYNGRNARIWVKVPRIPANSESKIVMYYGNPAATGASNGDATFEFFDDFEGTSIDGTKWYINHGTPSVSDGVLRLSGESVVSEKVRAFADNFILESRTKISETGKEPKSFLRSTNDYAVLDGSDRFEFGSWTNQNEMQLANLNNNLFYSESNREKFPTSFEVLGMVRSIKGTEAFRQYSFRLRNEKNIPDVPLYLQLYSWDGETHYIDWARVRKYASQEPETLITPTPINTSGQNSKSASVSLYGEKTDVILGENVLLKLSAINIIGNPIMHVQVIIIPPNGWSVISSAFSKSGAGQYTTIYDLKPEDGVRDIEVQIMPNQIGDNFEVKGRIVFYFGDDLSTKEDHPLSLPIKVRAKSNVEMTTGAQQSDNRSTPGFAFVVGIVGFAVATLYINKKSRF